MSVFVDKSCICPITELWADRDICDFGGNAILPVSDDNEYIFTSGNEIIKLSAEGKTIDFIFFEKENMHPTVTALGENYTNFLYKH